MSITDITQKLSGVKRSQYGFIAKCPAHDDGKQSLSIGENGGKVLLNCFAGCPPQKIVEAMGIEWKDLFLGNDGASGLVPRTFSQNGVGYHSSAKSSIAAVYRYTDENGELLYENVRFEPKGFGQRRYDEKGEPIWNLRGVRRVPYRLPELVNSVRHGSEVWLAEGEKDADALRELGLTATSFKGWSAEFNRYIEKTNVVIVRDHDLPGGVQADEAARIILKAAATVKVLDVHAEYEMPEKHGPDISDYVRACVQDEGMSSEDIAERLSIMADGLSRWVDPNVNGANLFIVKSGNQWIADAAKRPSPKMLFGEFWFQGELCILFADTNVGKSILAVQIGDAISRGFSNSPPYEGGVAAASADGVVLPSSIEPRHLNPRPENHPADEASAPLLRKEGSFLRTECGPQKVVYFDFELTDKQFESRVSTRAVGGDHYTDHYRFHENFTRAEVDPETSELYGFKSFEEFLNHSLDQTIVRENADVLIIDNLTYLRDETENARNALPLMKYLKELKSRHNISILALAHTPKRDSSKPLGRNDLQGSKMLINFCDSSFAIGESHREPGLRYLKQIKARNTAIIYHSENVLLANIAKRDSMLRFEFCGTGVEYEHLKTKSEKDRLATIERVKQLAAEGKSTREIAEEVGISHTTVARYLKGESVTPVTTETAP